MPPTAVGTICGFIRTRSRLSGASRMTTEIARRGASAADADHANAIQADIEHRFVIRVLADGDDEIDPALHERGASLAPAREGRGGVRRGQRNGPTVPSQRQPLAR